MHLSKTMSPLIAPKKAGLLHESTSIPLFILFLSSVSKEFYEDNVNKHQLSRMIHEISDAEDKKTLSEVIVFFETGGTIAHLLILPFSSPCECRDILTKNFSTHWPLRGLFEAADLLLLPQGAHFMDAGIFHTLLQCLFSFLTSYSSLFGLFDCPYKKTLQQAFEWRKGLHHDKAALFFSALLQKNQKIAKTATAFAGILQSIDKEHALFCGGFNQPLSLFKSPIDYLSPAEAQLLIDHQINVPLSLTNHQIVLWGDTTLSADPTTRSFTLSRIITAFQKAIEDICRKYLFEITSATTLNIIKTELQSLFEPYQCFLKNNHSNGLILHVSTQEEANQRGFIVECFISFQGFPDTINLSRSFFPEG